MRNKPCPASSTSDEGVRANGRPTRRHDAPGAVAWVDAAPAAHASLRRISPCLGHPLDQGQERPDAGRSPGLRVIARCTAFPGLAGVSVRPSGCDRALWPAAICIALTAHSCRDSLGFRGASPLTAFPFKPPYGSTNAIMASRTSRDGSRPTRRKWRWQASPYDACFRPSLSLQGRATLVRSLALLPQDLVHRLDRCGQAMQPLFRRWTARP